MASTQSSNWRDELEQRAPARWSIRFIQNHNLQLPNHRWGFALYRTVYAPAVSDEDFAKILERIKKIVAFIFSRERLLRNHSLDPEPDVIAAETFHLVVFEDQTLNGASLVDVQDRFKKYMRDGIEGSSLDIGNPVCLVVDSVSAKSILEAPEPSVENDRYGPTAARIRLVDAGDGDESDDEEESDEESDKDPWDGLMETHVSTLPDLYNNVVTLMQTEEERRPRKTTAGGLPLYVSL